MHIKTMEGLVGARTNMNLLNTPMRVYKEARRRGDLATMDRAMQYAGDFAEKTEEYEAKAEKGMEEDAKAAKEQAKADYERAIQKRREEREELEKRLAENNGHPTDTVKISEDGVTLLENSALPENTGTEYKPPAGTDTSQPMPVAYTNAAQPIQAQAGSGTNISISI